MAAIITTVTMDAMVTIDAIVTMDTMVISTLNYTPKVVLQRQAFSN